MHRRLHPLSLLLVLLALIAIPIRLLERTRAESRNRAVELVLDYNQLRQLTAVTGQDLPRAMRDAKARGARGIAVTEQFLPELVSAGRARVGEWTSRGAGAGTTTFTISEADLFARVREHLLRRLPQMRNPAPTDAWREVRVQGPDGSHFLVPQATVTDLFATPIGLDPAEVAMVHDAGLDTVARVYNFLGATPGSINFSLSEARRAGARTIIFAGEDVLGFQRQIAETQKALQQLGLLYGSVEFGKQRGDDELAQQVQDRLIRVHSIAPAEIARMTEPDAVDRYARAVSERSIRLCYVRLLGTVAEDTYSDNLEYLGKVAERIQRDGYRMDRVRPLEDVPSHSRLERLVDFLLGAGVGAAGLLLLASLFPIRRPQQALLALLFAALGGAALAVGGHKAHQLGALCAALIFPTLAFVWVQQPVGAFANEDRKWPPSPVALALVEFALMCAISGVGGLFVAAILSHRDYMLKVESFAGIKAAHVIPLFGVAAFYLLGLTNRGRWANEKPKLLQRAAGMLGEPLHIWQAIAGVLGLAVLALLVLRTGNDPGVGVSPLEMKFRTILEDHLVRPRTKEFLIGHPALLVGLALAATPRWRRIPVLAGLALPLLLVGAIGQASIVNSFCHIHTPFLTSAWRTFNGIWLGALIGLAVLAVLSVLDRRDVKPVAAAEY